jgi:hypothetical protein
MDIDNLCDLLNNKLLILNIKDEEYLELTINYLIFKNNLEHKLTEKDFEKTMDRYVRYLFGISWGNRNDIEDRLNTFVNYCNPYISLSNEIIRYIDNELFQMIKGDTNPLYNIALEKFKIFKDKHHL